MQPLNVRYSCGSVMTVSPSDLAHFTYEQMFFKNATVWIVCLNYECYSLSPSHYLHSIPPLLQSELHKQG